MAIKKGYDNPESWEKLENEQTKKSTRIIHMNNETINTDTDEDELDSIDIAEAFEDESEEDFSEVLSLTEYTDGNGNTGLAKNNYDNVVAEYTDINIVNVDKKHKLAAQAFVSKVTKFILDFNDVALTEEHKKWLRQVGNLQLQQLQDMLYMVDVNKQMLNNIVQRVNATQAEDYAIINSYSSLVTMHLKLHKELQNAYKSIPSTLKKMKAEVLCNQELDENSTDNEVIGQNYGDTQFNSSKQMLRKLIEQNEIDEASKDNGDE